MARLYPFRALRPRPSDAPRIAAVPYDVVNTDEARTRVIQSLYQQFLGRQADPTGLNLSLSFLRAGGPIQKIRAIIAGSAEFFTARSGSNNTTFVTNLYQDVLKRPVDPVGQSLAGQALTGGTDRIKVAEAVLDSPEGQQVLVQSYYTQFLRRTADSVGLSLATAALARGVDEVQIEVVIGSSDEYFNLG